MAPQLNDNDCVELELFHREKGDESGIPPVSEGMLLQEKVLEVEAINEKEKKGNAGKQTASVEERASTVVSLITSSLAILMLRLSTNTATSKKNPTSSPRKQVLVSSHCHMLFLGQERSEQSTTGTIVHDCDEFRKLQRQMGKPGTITNQGTRQILNPLLEKQNKREEEDRVPRIITLQVRSFKWSCNAGADSQTGRTKADEMVLANELIDWYIDFPTTRDRGPCYEDDVSYLSEELEDDEVYSYLWSYDD